MRHKISAVLVPLFLLSLTAGCGADDGADDPIVKTPANGEVDGIGGGKELTMVILTSSNPPAQVGTDNSATGYVMDMARAAADILDYDLKFVALDFASGVTAVQSGRYDMEAFMFGNQERYQAFDVAVYYKQSNTVVTLAEDGLNIQEASDLCGHKLAVSKGSTYMSEVDKTVADCKSAGNPLEIIELADAPSGYLALKAGRVDMHLIQTDYAEAEVAKDDAVEAQPLDYFPQLAGLGFAKKNGELAKQFSAAYNKLIESGTYTEILDKYGVSTFAIEQSEINPEPIN